VILKISCFGVYSSVLDFCTAAPLPFKFAGRTLLVGALKMREEGLLVGYLRVNTKRPTELLREILDLYPPEDRREALKQATYADREWPPSPTSPEGQRVLLMTPEGQRYFLGIVLRKYQPAMKDEEVEEILAGLSDGDFLAIAHVAFGEDGTDPNSARATVAGLKQALADAARPDASPGSPTGGSSSPTSP
jgi:hypothetical protein